MVKVAFFEEAVEIPEDVEVKVEGNNKITVKGPEGGPVTKDFSHARGIRISVDEDGKKIVFSTHFPGGETLALIKTLLNITSNLIEGVQKNFEYVCKVCYSHFPCNVEAKPNKGELHVVNFLGERAPRVAKYNPDLVDVRVEDDDVHLIGPDKEALGQTAANLKRATRIRLKDPRIYQDGVYSYKIKHGNEVLWEIR
ncbi:MAG: 50S ribosomal protein L6 [Promethearchaeota archaeon]|nr:MAG: 50S ribosomal protein L6 [Candidatus Lokiarchaeota archaeon]